MRSKLILYHLSKWIGLFALAARWNRKKLPILCYHGFATSDENVFRPKLFMKGTSFRARMQYLHRQGYHVLTLEKAVQCLQEGTLPKKAVVITIDDGFYSVFVHAMPVLAELSFPATLYLTSYHVEKGSPVFRLVVQYMFWKTSCRSLELRNVTGADASVDLSQPAAHTQGMWELIEYGETRCDEAGRQSLARRLGQELGVSYGAIVGSRALSLMTVPEILTLLENGIDIQLHTHRHRFPEDRETVLRELFDNARFLQQLTNRPLTHFCYPSGLWSKAQWAWLSEFGVVTATTCDSGMNLPDTPLLGLRRFLDSENISQIEFEAELCGFAQFLREAGTLSGRRRPVRVNPDYNPVPSIPGK